MKGLDTPLLLAVLRGDSGGRELVRSLSDEELVTTEVNLLELELLARADPTPGRERRLDALDRLRKKLTVLPIDESAVRRGTVAHAGWIRTGLLPQRMILGALEAAGCSEWFTSKELAASGGLHLKMRITPITFDS
jgi:predicted nucleic acid-binding protein